MCGLLLRDFALGTFQIPALRKLLGFVFELLLEGIDARRRFVINALTRLRYCTADGRMDLSQKGPPGEVAPPLAPWFTFGDARSRGARVICGHWSALGFSDCNGVVALDTGCVWGGALTALPLDEPDTRPIAIACRAHLRPTLG